MGSGLLTHIPSGPPTDILRYVFALALSLPLSCNLS
jgi:hypothetical protein